MLSLEKCQLEPTQEFTQLGVVFNTQDINLSLPQDKVLLIKTQAAKVTSSPACRGVMRLLGLTNVANMVLPLARIHSHPLQFWHKDTYKIPAYLFKGLKTNWETIQTLHWWHSFKLQPKSIYRPLVEEVVTADTLKDGYGGHMNNLSFRGKQHAKKGGTPNINILELKAVWKACQKLKEAIRGEDYLFLDRHPNSSSLSVATGRASLPDFEWSWKENPTQMSQEWGCSMLRIPQGCSKPLGKCLIQGQGSSGVEPGRPIKSQVIQTVGNSSSRPFWKHYPI